MQTLIVLHTLEFVCLFGANSHALPHTKKNSKRGYNVGYVDQ